MDLHIITIITFLVAFVELNLVVVIFLGSKTHSSRVFAILAIANAIWSITLGFLHEFVTDISVAKILFSITFYEGLFISIFFFYFTLTYTDKGKPPYRVLAVLLVFFVSQYPIYFTEGLISANIQPALDHFGWMWSYGSVQMIFLIPFSSFWTIGLINLFIKSRKHPVLQTRKHLSFMFWAMLVSIIPTSLFSLVFPMMFNIYEYNTMSPAIGIFWVSILAYSIMKHNQMNIRIVFKEILVLIAILLLFINIFI